MLELKNISASYKNTNSIITDIDFTVQKNHINAIIGKNGSGKSTLVKCICGTLGYSGKILHNGNDITALDEKGRAKLISLLPQTLPRIPLSVYEVAQMGRTPYTGLSGVLSQNDISIVENALITAGVYDMRYKNMNELSGGERQRAYLALVLAQDSELLVLDEPTSHMDIKHETELLKLLKELTTTKNKTVLSVMHNISLAFKYADYITIIDNGIQIFTGSIQECLSCDITEKTFGVKRKTTTDGDIVFMAD